MPAVKVNRPEPRQFITSLEVGTLGFFASSVSLFQRGAKAGVGQVAGTVSSDLEESVSAGGTGLGLHNLQRWEDPSKSDAGGPSPSPPF